MFGGYGSPENLRRLISGPYFGGYGVFEAMDWDG